MDITLQLSKELNIRQEQAQAAVRLIDEGNTIPFISRYRKDVTGGLNDEVLRNLHERLEYIRNLEDKKQQVIRAITQQDKMTPELMKQITAADTMVAVEDLYLPYRPKRRTRASVAREKGLEPLAEDILAQEPATAPMEAAAAYVDEEKGVADVSQAIDGARDIIAEQIADRADFRRGIRSFTMNHGILEVRAKDEKESSVYEMYYNFQEKLSTVTGYRILAINRGEKEKFLTVSIRVPENHVIAVLNRSLVREGCPDRAEIIREAAADSYRRLIAPAIERDIRNELTERAQEGAITVFGKNLKQLLMQPPIAGRTVLGWDPAFRTGCKLAVVDPTGKVLDTVIVYPTAPQMRVEEAKRKVHQLIRKYGIQGIRAGDHGNAPGNPGKCGLCDRQ